MGVNHMNVTQTVIMKKGIIKSFFISECERQLVGDLLNEQVIIENKGTELAAAGSSLEQLFKQKLLSNSLFLHAPEVHYDDGE
jgi:hypothetical protein